MFCVATRWLEKNASAINALNVFPVPDGDTGTNMLLTMRSTMAEATRPADNVASDVAQAMAKGALMGARGNSGVILSQIFKGLAEGFEGHEFFGPQEMTQALGHASAAAYRGISRPQEGTMLTVIKDVATTAKNSTRESSKDLVSLMEAVVEEAKKSVERTPELLDVLKEAGVVDAGGQGICVILEGILHYLRGEVEDIELVRTEAPATLQPAFVAARSMPREEEIYGYCTEFIIKGENLDYSWIRERIESKGESVLVVGDATTTKVHIHTPHPGEIIEFAISLGSVHDLKIENMDDQHEEFLQMRRAPMPAAEIAVVAVVAGSGLEDVFRSLGATAIIPGGQTMNPSCSDILQAVDLVPSDKVIVLPNNKNIVPAARQAATISKKKVKVLPTRSIPQGLAAMLAFNCEMELDSNTNEMAKAQERVKCVEITRAVRDAKLGQVQMKKGDFIGLIDGKIKVSSDDLTQAVANALKIADAEEADIASLYYGDEIEGEEARSLSQALQAQLPDLEVEVIEGGQPHYAYIIAVE
jgi:DAK2 domain fusion protein YloV